MRLVTWSAAALLAVLVAWSFHGLPAPVSAGAAAARPQVVPTAGPMPAPLARQVAREPDPPAQPPATFEQLAERIVDLTLAGGEQVRREELAAADATHAEVVELVGRLVASHADFASRALFALTGLPGDDARAAAGRAVHGRLLQMALERDSATAAQGERGPLDELLRGLLQSMVPHAPIAEVIASILIDRGYLGAPQEDGVLRLAELVPTYPWLAEPARRLLLTLWHNLERTGARARDQIETLALMLKDDANPARRAAALERLVSSTERELVEFVLHDVEGRGDGDRARDLAAAAAARLPADQALAVVQRLRRLAPTALVGPALELARRDEAGVRTAYGQLLAQRADPEFRADLVSGLGFNPNSANLTVVETALRSDPEPRVRERAVLALTASAAAAFGVRAVTQALDDATFAGERLSVLVGALENLARAGEAEAVAALGKRLGARPDLPPLARGELEQLLRTGPPRRLR